MKSEKESEKENEKFTSIISHHCECVCVCEKRYLHHNADCGRENDAFEANDIAVPQHRHEGYLPAKGREMIDALCGTV